MSDKLLVEKDGDVAVIRLNDPATMNAVTSALASELHAAIEEAGRTSRAILLGSGERAFCSGANLSGGTIQPGDPNADAGATLESHFNPLMMAIRNSAVPIVSAVRGAAAGVGSSLALSADMIVAGKSAYFMLAFARIGLVPDGGATWLLTKAAGRARAMEMMLLAEKIPAATALDWGLINRLVEDDKIDETAMELAQRLAKGPQPSIRLIRKQAWLAADSGFAEVLQAEREHQRDAGRSKDFAEGVSAFLQKRPAKFGG